MWRSGDVVAIRHVRHGRVFLAWSANVVEDRDDVLAVWIPPGAECMRPPVRDALPYDQELVPWPWSAPGVLQLYPRDAAHAVWLFGDAWYVNLQEPYRRTALGIDTADHLLDLVRTRDGHWRWKDEADLAAAVEGAFLTDEDAAAIRAEAERVIAADPFPTGWEAWGPDPAWPLPTLRVGWDVV